MINQQRLRTSRTAQRISIADPQDLLPLAIDKFIELDLLRFGHLPDAPASLPGFGVVRQSSELNRFVRDTFLSDYPEAASLLEMLAEGHIILIDLGEVPGKLEFTFAYIDDDESAPAGINEPLREGTSQRKGHPE